MIVQAMAAGPQPTLGLCFHPEELARVVGGRLADRQQDEVLDAGRLGRRDQVGIAIAVDLP